MYDDDDDINADDTRDDADDVKDDDVKDDDDDRHDICQKKNYATAVLGTRILRKKRVNHDISQFATKEHKWFKMA